MTSQAFPKLSVIVPVHNGARYLEECLASVLDSLACSFVGLGDAPWYVYHLGRGETLGA